MNEQVPAVYAECGSCGGKGLVGGNTIDGTIYRGDDGLWRVEDLNCMDCGEGDDIFVQSLDSSVEWYEGEEIDG